MRNTDHTRKGRQSARALTPRTSAEMALLLAALLACAVALLIVNPGQATAQDTSGGQQKEDRGRADDGGSDGRGSDDGGSGNSLGVIVDIPKGWPLGGDSGHDIVRFEKCFPFCHVERPDGGSPQDSTVIDGGTGEQTNVIEQTQITQETQTDGGGADDEGGTDEGGPSDDQYETEEGNDGGTDQGNGGGNGGEDEPEEPTTSEETTVLEETTAPPGQTAKCPTGPSGPISEVTLTRILDADTLEVEGSDGNAYTIRLIGAEAPDLAGGGAQGGEDEPGAEEAAAFAGETLGGKGQKLQLEYDAQKTDENGQTFAYVWKKNTPEEPKHKTTQELFTGDEVGTPVLYNRTLVEEGYARAATAEPNTDYAECLMQSEKAARADATGLWMEQAFSPGAGGATPTETKARPNNETAAAVPLELVSRKTPLSESRNEGNARDAQIPPITGHAKAPEPPQAREAHPGIGVGLIFIALLAGAAVLTRAVAGTREPAAIGSPEGRN